MERLKGYRIEKAPLRRIPMKKRNEYAFKETNEKGILWRLKGYPFKKNCPFILITPSFKRGYFGVWRDLADALTNRGFNILISPFLENDGIDRLLGEKLLNGIVLSGGNDITPELYGGDKKSAYKPDLRRDKFEISIYKKSMKKKTPVLAICRGLQVVNVAHGGSLVSGLMKHKKDERVNAHQIKIRENSLFKRLSNTKFLRVGSSHHQAIGRPGKNLTSIAESDDGVIEMIEFKNHPLIATQFHPERSQDGRAVFEAFRKLVIS